ncbi:MAG: VanW family protein [Chloroflexia bacterium]
MPSAVADVGSRALMRRLTLAHLRQEGEAALLTGLRERAQAYFRQALALDDRDADLWALLGATFPEREARRGCARQSLALDPGNRLASFLLEEKFPCPPPSLLRGRVAAEARIRPAVHLPGRILATLLLLVVLALDILWGGLYAWKYEGCFFPGIRLAGLDLGGLSYSQARSLLERDLAAFLNRPLLLEAGGLRWSLRAEEAGLRYRLDEALEAAWALGRSGPAPLSWWERMRLGLLGQEVPLPAALEDAVLTEVIGRLAGALDRPAGPPELAWTEGRWTISPGRDGRHLDRPEAEARLRAALSLLAEGRGPAGEAPWLVALPVVTESLALSEAEVARLEEEVGRAGRPLTLRCGEHTWTAEPPEIAPWLRIRRGSLPDIQVDPEAVRAYLDALAPQLERPAERPRLEMRDGRAAVFRPGRDGLALDLERAPAEVVEALQRRLQGEEVEAVELSTVVLPAGNEDFLAELGVLAPVGEGTSTFVGSSPERAENIRIGGAELHGRLIAPDEVFSLNEALYPITWEKGYRYAPVISGGYLVMGLGGGLCQVATTLYRAVLYSGLEIVERHPHLWRVEYYEQDAPPGFDATISQGGPDLRFRNNTGRYLLIQVETDLEHSRQTIRFYGTPPGWTVTIDRYEIGNGGHTVSYRRTVSRDGQVLLQETIYSFYQ